MNAPDALITELLKQARTLLYSRLPERSWFTQQTRVKLALTLPAKWLEDRQVEVSAERYQAIVQGILDTIKAKGRTDLGPYPCAYLWQCVESHLRHHIDEYYTEGKNVRNAIKAGMSYWDRAQLGADGTVTVLDKVHSTLKTGTRKSKNEHKPTAQMELFL